MKDRQLQRLINEGKWEMEEDNSHYSFELHQINALISLLGCINVQLDEIKGYNYCVDDIKAKCWIIKDVLNKIGHKVR